MFNYLADELTITYLTYAVEEAEKRAKAAKEKAKADVNTVKDDPFVGFMVAKSKKDHNAVYLLRQG